MQFEVKGVKYQTGTMAVLDQMGVAVRIMPLFVKGFAEIVPVYLELKEKGLGLGDISMARLKEIIPEVARELTRMSDEDRKYIVETCLSAVERENPNGKGWAPAWNRQSKRPMFKELDSDLGAVLGIVMAVIEEKIAPFLPAPLSDLPAIVRASFLSP